MNVRALLLIGKDLIAKTRTPRIDMVVTSGWILLVFAGQLLITSECEPFEWFSLLWLCMGMLIVRKTVCLPLLIMTCPLFMCEIQRKWAWGQELVALTFFLRVMIEGTLTTRQRLGVILAAVAMLFMSFPSDFADISKSLHKFSTADNIKYFARPEAVWAHFSLRQSLDRSLIVGLLTSLFLAKAYFSTSRVWKAIMFCGLSVLIVTYGNTLLPGQHPHKYLGTTNHGFIDGYLFHGAGYNVSYYSMILIVALPALFAPLKTRYRWVCLGCTGLLFPVVVMDQDIYYLVAYFLLFVALVVLFCSLAFRGTRLRLLAHWKFSSTEARKTLIMFLLCLCISFLWFVKMGFFNPESALRSDLKWKFSKEVSNLQALWPLFAVGTAVVAGAALTVLIALFKWTGKWISRLCESRPPVVKKSIYGVMAAMVLLGVGFWVNAQFPLDQNKRYKRVRRTIVNSMNTRYYMWHTGWRKVKQDYIFVGSGAGTWARYHRSQTRVFHEFYAHMHNTYLDLMFEYGLISVLILMALSVFSFARILFHPIGMERVWVYYLLIIFLMAGTQHMFYTFTNQCLLLPAFLILARGVRLRKSESE